MTKYRSEDETPCKHLAALLYGLENGAVKKSSKEKNEPVIAQIVSQLSREQMRQLLIQFAQNDASIWETILLTTTDQLPQTQKQIWEQDLQELTDNAVDRHGFIDYAQAYDYCCALMEYLSDRVPELLSKGLIMEAFDLVCFVFQTGMEQEMDDSDGGLTMLANYCMSDWNMILKLASTEQQKEMYHRFCAEYQKGDLTQMFLEEYIFAAPWNAEIAPEVLSFLDQEIQSCLESKRCKYRLNELVPRRIHWMEQVGESPREQAAYLKKYHQLPVVREIEIAQAKCDGDWTTAIALLKESKHLDSDMPGLVARYSEQLIAIYETLHDDSAMRIELEYYLFTFGQDDLQYVEKLKMLLPPAEWENMRTKLLNSRSMLHQIYPLLYQEGLYGQLMDRIEHRTDIYALEKYEDLLKKEFPQRCVAIYKAYLHQAMDIASTRKAYCSIIQTLKKLRKYPEGDATAQAVAEQWKQKYPRRTSMLDELRKAGY